MIPAAADESSQREDELTTKMEGEENEDGKDGVMVVDPTADAVPNLAEDEDVSSDINSDDHTDPHLINSNDMAAIAAAAESIPKTTKKPLTFKRQSMKNIYDKTAPGTTAVTKEGMALRRINSFGGRSLRRRIAEQEEGLEVSRPQMGQPCRNSLRRTFSQSSRRALDRMKDVNSPDCFHPDDVSLEDMKAIASFLSSEEKISHRRRTID